MIEYSYNFYESQTTDKKINFITPLIFELKLTPYMA